jgi:DNA replication protein DnaC
MKKLETRSMVLLQHHLKALKLPTLHAEREKVATRRAQDNVDHLGFLLQLCELELIEREKRAAERRLKGARFPNIKTLEMARVTGPISTSSAASSPRASIPRQCSTHPPAVSYSIVPARTNAAQ